MLEHLKKLNPDIQFYDVYSPEFSTFGRIIKALDTDELIGEAKKIENPAEGSSYLPSVESFEALRIAETVENEIFGSLRTQVGYCWGHNSRFNATEWHKGSELNVAVTPLVLILGHVWDIEDGKIDSSKFAAFYVPAGTAVEVYETTLHFCPCEVDAHGFGCIVALPYGTNTNLEITPENKILFRKNKWLLCHNDNKALIEKGVVAGISGINYEIKY